MALQIDKRINKTLILSFGGNVGNVRGVFKSAKVCVEEEIGKVVKKSSLYKTAAWGVENQPDFLNQVLIVETNLTPKNCLTKILAIEKKMGRIRSGKRWEERVIDIDMLFYEDEIIDLKELKVPHPYIQDRNFILVPLAEVCCEYVHPQLNKTIIVLKNECNDRLKVEKVF